MANEMRLGKSALDQRLFLRVSAGTLSDQKNKSLSGLNFDRLLNFQIEGS